MVWSVENGPSCTGADGVTYSAPGWWIWDNAPEGFSVLQFDGNGFGRRTAGVGEPCATGGTGVAEVVVTLKADGTAAPLRTVSNTH